MPLIHYLLPDSDGTRVAHRVIPAPIRVVYDAALNADFLDAPRRNVAIRVLFGLRGAFEHASSIVRRRPFVEPPAPATLRLADLPDRGEWITLGEVAPTEFAFGVIGRFWAGETSWLKIDGPTFAMFRQPGYARIGCQLLLEPLSADRTLITYEARTRATDNASRRAFKRYWRFVSPFVGYIMGATLSLIERNAVRAYTNNRVARHSALSSVA